MKKGSAQGRGSIPTWSEVLGQDRQRKEFKTPPKYGNRKSGGYASVKEHRRADELRVMERAGRIKGLREQVSYELLPPQRDAGSGTLLERPVRYIADFVYEDTQTGATVVEDTKGVRTPEYIIKRKLMLWVHGIRIAEV